VEANGGQERLVSVNYWKLRVPKPLLDLPGLADVMKEIMQEPAVQLETTRGVLASKILEHAHAIIEKLPESCCFKIGLTRHPVHRWGNHQYGYKLDPSWCSMKVVAIFVHGESAGVLESALIFNWRKDPRCVNEAGGGETVSTLKGPFFVYVVVGAPSKWLSCGAVQ
jgi:hypothetical protein